jgi:hypothetical protein
VPPRPPCLPVNLGAAARPNTQCTQAPATIAADVYTRSTTFWIMESLRLDLGLGSQVHP